MNLFKIAGSRAESLFNSLGGFNRVVSNQKFRDDLLVLLETRKGSLIGDPEYGSNLHQLLFEPANEATANRIRMEVANTVEKYYDNFLIDRVDVTFKSHTVLLNIYYKLINSNIEDSVMLEFISGNIN